MEDDEIFNLNDSIQASPLWKDFECLRPLDELHRATSFYSGMSNARVPSKVLLSYRQ